MRKLQNVCGIVVAMTLVLALAVAPSSGVSAQDQVPPQHLKEVPQEVLDFFGDGLTIEEFLSQTNGYIPFALKEYAEKDVTVIVEMTEPALAAKLVAENKLPSQMSPLSQAAYTNSLKLAQKPVKELVLGAKGLVLGEYTKAYNGVMVRIAAKELSAIRALAGVKAVHKAPVYEINLDASVPLIGADDVWVSPDGYAGEGVTIAIIDTGIDYTHASFGGAGTAAAYSTNNPNVVEAGTFPTAKVIGGYDFAGTTYDAGGTGAALIPVPDPDPLDEGGHGTHVASTSAGFEVVDGLTTKIGSGVAPDALLYALKVFGADGSTDLVVSALEWAMDPNGDGDISDHVDVVNMSLGSSFGPGDVDDPDVVASNNAVGVGVIVVTSSGNSGAVEYITGAPGTASGNLSVAASTTGSGMMPFIKYEGTEVPYLPSIPFTSTTPVTLVDVDMVDDTGTGLLCNVAGANPVLTPADALSGKLALIQRGTCSFEEKLVNAQELGAVGAIIYNASTSANDYISMLTGAATIPSGHTLYSYGVTLKGLHNLVVTVGPDTNVKRFPSVTPADYVASFSSRGPRGTDSILKPEVTAPGVAIFAAQMGSGSEGVSFNGTSMASPHVAGVAALVRQAHPDWTVEQVKAAIMNTAVDMNPADVNGYQVVPRTGAGRVDAFEAVFTDYVAVGDEDLVSLSWGLIEIEPITGDFIAPDVKTVRVYNDTAAPISFTISSTISGNAGLMDLEMPATVTVAPYSWQAFPVILHILPTGILYDFFDGELPEFYGFVELTETTVGDVELRVPFYFVARPVSKLTVTGTPDLTMDADGLGEAQINLAQTGPIGTYLWAYTAMHVDGNDLAQLDEGDQRLIGLDYQFTDTTYGDIIGVALNTWGSTHNPQPYFVEHDVYIDADQDGLPETVNFNFNQGWFSTGASNNVWFVVQVDFTDGMMYPGSPWLIGTDFNTGLMEYYLPATWNYVNNMATVGGDTDYTVEVVTFDYNGNIDASPVMYYDNARPPFGFDLLDGMPFNSPDTLSAWVNDLGGYFVTQPKGVMLLDYHGKPGVGQAYFWPLTVEGVPTYYLPFIAN